MKKSVVYNGLAKVQSHSIKKEIVTTAYRIMSTYGNVYAYVVNTSKGAVYEIKSSTDLHLKDGDLIRLNIKRPTFKTFKGLEAVLEETEIRLPPKKHRQSKHRFKAWMGSLNAFLGDLTSIVRVDKSYLKA